MVSVIIAIFPVFLLIAIWIALSHLVRTTDRAPVLVAGECIARAAGIAGCGVGFGHTRKLRHIGGAIFSDIETPR